MFGSIEIIEIEKTQILTLSLFPFMLLTFYGYGPDNLFTSILGLKFSDNSNQEIITLKFYRPKKMPR
jgi:hypothetical protein